jgi:transcriptional regulator with XRE-family HTH domain
MMKKVQRKMTVATNLMVARLGQDMETEVPESAEERVSRLYKADGGPLVSLLIETAQGRKITLQDMAREVGVTYGYINQLRTGFRKTSQISHDFAAGCAEFLGIPTVAVLILGGFLTMSDFSVRAESEEVMLDRAMRLVQDDPVVRAGIPVDLSKLCIDGKRAVALLYAEVSGKDVFQAHRLPDMVRWLQRAVMEHDENSFAAVAGHQDTSAGLRS